MENKKEEFNLEEIKKKALAQLRSGQSLYGKDGATQASQCFPYSNIVVMMMNKKMTQLILHTQKAKSKYFTLIY
jgi:hypothetical protein